MTLQRAGRRAGALVTVGYFNAMLSLAAALTAALATLTLFVLVHLASAGLARPAWGTGLLLPRVMLGLLLARLSPSFVVLAVLAALVLTTLVLVRHKYLANARHHRERYNFGNFKAVGRRERQRRGWLTFSPRWRLRLSYIARRQARESARSLHLSLAGLFGFGL